MCSVSTRRKHIERLLIKTMPVTALFVLSATGTNPSSPLDAGSSCRDAARPEQADGGGCCRPNRLLSGYPFRTVRHYTKAPGASACASASAYSEQRWAGPHLVLATPLGLLIRVVVCHLDVLVLSRRRRRPPAAMSPSPHLGRLPSPSSSRAPPAAAQTCAAAALRPRSPFHRCILSRDLAAASSWTARFVKLSSPTISTLASRLPRWRPRRRRPRRRPG